MKICLPMERLVSTPTTLHHQATMRILRYLKQTPEKRIFLAANSEIQLKGYSDSDWVRSTNTIKSLS